MSSSTILAAEVEALRSLVEALRLRVVGLEERVQHLEGGERSQRSEVEEVSGFGSYSVISRHGSIQQPAESFGSPKPSTTEILVGDTEGRVQLARQIGAFLRRCRDGQPRGGSGRDRLKLQSRYYIILATYAGEFLADPLVVDNFAEVRRLCKRGPDLGESVFIGVPTQWETRLVLESGGFAVPHRFQHA